jgi:tRNA dimethylallyltransferase
MTPEHLAVLGPTCSWKSAVAVLAAERLHGEILNCDSMQVYPCLDIGTAKPTPAERARLPHHLVDCVALDAPCDAAVYVALAEPVLNDLESRGTTAVLVGGTGLYARSLIYGLRLLPADRTLAAELQRRLAAPHGRQALISELEAHSAGFALPKEIIDNPRRLLRAVEVTRLTGCTPWQLHRLPTAPPRYSFRQYLLIPEMSVLKGRIAERTQAMLRAGWIDEAEMLIQRGLLSTPTARQALGYREIAAFLAGTIPSRSELQDLLVRRTVAYARRQRTWFRHQHPGAVIVDIQRDTTPEEIVTLILRHRELCRTTAGDPPPRLRIG